MKKILPGVFFFFVLISSFSFGETMPNGVAGLNWNDNLKDCIAKGLCDQIFVSKGSDGSISTRGTSNIKIGPLTSHLQSFSFDKDTKKLSEVTLNFNGQKDDYEKISKALTAKYGSCINKGMPDGLPRIWKLDSIFVSIYLTISSDNYIMLMYIKDWSISELKDDL